MPKKLCSPFAPWAEPLRQAKEKSGLTYPRIMEKTGLSRSTINKIFQGKESVLLRHVDKLAACFGLELVIGFEPRKD